MHIKKNWGSNNYVRQNRLQNKGHNERQTRSLYKGVVQQEDITVVNIYASNIGAPNNIKKILEDFKKDVYSNSQCRGF